MEYLQVKDVDDKLSYIKLKAFLNIYNGCPARLKGDSNNSDAFKRSVEHLKNFSYICKDKTEKIIRFVHIRLEEKFKDYRHAFRSFDTNYNGTLSFKEFITGMENIGIRLELEDFKVLFETIDYDKDG